MISDADLDKEIMAGNGSDLVTRWCVANAIPVPPINFWGPESRYYHVNSCGFYASKNRSAHPGSLNVMPGKCASIGRAAMAWSFPGYVTDRTPYGVVAHELGHAMDEDQGLEFSSLTRETSGEARLTSYCPDDGEWFAEMFRLFVTNPHLLHLIRPRTFDLLATAYPHRAEKRGWDSVLARAPERTLEMAARKIADARKGRNEV